MQQNSSCSEPTFQQLVYTLAKLQGKPKAGLTEVIQTQVQILTNKVRQISQLRKLKMSTIKRKIENLTQQCNQIIVGAQNFASEIEKSLKQSQRQCYKRIQRLERDRLQKQVEIKTIIDQQVLAIVQQSTMTLQLGSHFQEQNQQIRSLNIQVEQFVIQMKNVGDMKYLDDLNKQVRITHTNMLREKTEKLNDFKKKTNQILKNLDERLQRVKRERQRWEQASIRQIQQIVEFIMKKHY